jgi:hypothetical protein
MIDDLRQRRRCRRLVDRLSIPEPFHIETFTAALAGERGRPIELIEVGSPRLEVCGAVASTADADYVFYPRDTTALHQRHIVFHEVAHLLCGGRGVSVESDVATTLLPSLPPELVERVLGRSTYLDPHEREVEIVATLLARRVDGLDRRDRRRRAIEVAAFDPLFDSRPRGRRRG